MKLKGLAVFSVAIMALIAAPQAAKDFRDFLGCVAETAQVEFLHAVLNSHKEASSAGQVAAPGQRPMTICSNQKPQPRAAESRRSKPALSPAHPVARLSTPAKHRVMQNDPDFEIASMDLSGITALAMTSIPVADETRPRVVVVKAAKRSTVPSEPKKGAGLEYAQNILRSIRVMEKARAFRELQRTPLPAIKVNLQMPIMPLVEPAVSSPAPAAMPVRAIACTGSPDVAGVSE